MRGFILDFFNYFVFFYTSTLATCFILFAFFYILKTKKKLLRRELYPEND